MRKNFILPHILCCIALVVLCVTAYIGAGGYEEESVPVYSQDIQNR